MLPPTHLLPKSLNEFYSIELDNTTPPHLPFRASAGLKRAFPLPWLKVRVVKEGYLMGAKKVGAFADPLTKVDFVLAQRAGI
jgi:hypothetical protein